jgi:glucose-1-phosphate adenylyltransferase
MHLFDGYWEDIGTIKSFYHANLDLAGPEPQFTLYSPDTPIFSRARFLPPSRMDGAHVKSSLVADGCVIGAGSVIENSVVGLRCQIGRNVTIKNSILMGADYYEKRERASAGAPPIGVGENTTIDGAIIDKNCRIGRDVVIVNRDGVECADLANEAYVRDRIVVVSKEAVLADGTKV